MKTYSHESYHDQQCSGVAENDVIDLEIPGKGIFSRVKRWWFDLFLLSYTDIRSKQYYVSSYAMMVARSGQFRQNRSTIHPFSKFSNIWECLVVHVYVIHMIMFHLTSSIIYSPDVLYYYLLAGIEYIFIVDIFVNARTGYAIKRTRQVVMKSPDVLLNYLSTNSFLHAMCAIPVQNLMFLSLGKDIADPTKKANLFVTALKVITVVHIVRLLQASAYWAKDRGTFRRTMTFKFIRIIIVGLVVMFKILTIMSACHVIDYVMWGIRDPDCFLGQALHFKYQSPVGDEALYLFLLISRICKSFFLCGYSLQPHTQSFDQITVMLTYASAFQFHFWASVLLYDCVARINSMDDNLLINRGQTLSLLRNRGMCDMIHDKVIQYFDYKDTSLVVVEHRNCLYKSLPRALKAEIKMSCYEGFIKRVPCFTHWPSEVICGIVELLKSEIYLSGDVVSNTGNQEELVVVDAGLLAVYSEAEEIGHLVDGDYFGELVSTEEPVVVVVTASTVLILDEIYFRNMMMQYPHLFYEVKWRDSMDDNTIPATPSNSTLAE